MMKYYNFFILIAITWLVACSSDDVPQKEAINIDLSLEWEVSTPMDEDIMNLSAAIQSAQDHPRLTSLIVVRNGKLVVEEYFDGFGRDDAHDVRSVTKSVVSALTGIAVENNFIPDINAGIDQYLTEPDYSLTEEQKAIKIVDLLTMSAGFEWDEWNTGIYNDWILSGMPLEFLLSRPMVTAPGSDFSYNSASTYLLGLVLYEATGMTLSELADAHLFNEMAFSGSDWEYFNDGTINGGAGVELRPLDMAKFGQLYLQRGSSAGRQIIASDWIDFSVAPAYNWRFDYGALTNCTYGQLWWTRDSTADTGEAFLAWGYGGQYIYVVPEKNLVVVTTSDWVNASEAGGSDFLEMEALDIIINQIVPEVN